jgi:hypothetical protein
MWLVLRLRATRGWRSAQDDDVERVDGGMKTLSREPVARRSTAISEVLRMAVDFDPNYFSHGLKNGAEIGGGSPP